MCEYCDMEEPFCICGSEKKWEEELVRKGKLNLVSHTKEEFVGQEEKSEGCE